MDKVETDALPEKGWINTRDPCSKDAVNNILKEAAAAAAAAAAVYQANSLDAITTRRTELTEKGKELVDNPLQ